MWRKKKTKQTRHGTLKLLWPVRINEKKTSHFRLLQKSTNIHRACFINLLLLVESIGIYPLKKTGPPLLEIENPLQHNYYYSLFNAPTMQIFHHNKTKQKIPRKLRDAWLGRVVVVRSGGWERRNTEDTQTRRMGKVKQQQQSFPVQKANKQTKKKSCELLVL